MGGVKAIEIKTLFVVDAENNRGRGFGAELLRKAEEYARSVGAENLLVTVSNEKPESYNFFVKNGFKRVRKEIGKYKKYKMESTLIKEL